MVVSVLDNGEYIKVDNATSLELSQLRLSFTKKIDNWFIIKRKYPNFNENKKFINNFNIFPIGLWKELEKVCEKYKFSLSYGKPHNFVDINFDEIDFRRWVDEYFSNSDIKPYFYQIDAAIEAFKYKRCTEEISTSGGKTLIAFIIFMYLYRKGIINKILYITPSVGLVSQTSEEFYSYAEKANQKVDFKVSEIYSGASTSKLNDANITIGTYQSLCKKNPDFFSQFDMVIVDECHHSKNKSISKILIKCIKATYKIGLSGTIPTDGSYSAFLIQSYLGPVVYTLTSKTLIENGKATPITVVQIYMNYLSAENKKMLYEERLKVNKDGGKLYNLEKQFVRQDKKRLKYICETIAKSNKNSLILFSDVQNEYGRNVFNYLKDNTDKVVYYIDGSTKSSLRDYYKSQMEQRDDILIVASIGVFSEGISIKNLYKIFLIETSKSENIVAQILGRGMRLFNGKNECIIFDFVDDFSYGTGKQKYAYLYRHGVERKNIYQKRQFPLKRINVNL